MLAYSSQSTLPERTGNFFADQFLTAPGAAAGLIAAAGAAAPVRGSAAARRSAGRKEEAGRGAPSRSLSPSVATVSPPSNSVASTPSALRETRAIRGEGQSRSGGKEAPGLSAALVADARSRLAADFEELYRQQASLLEARARERVREEAATAEAQMEAIGSSASSAAMAGRAVHPEVTALEGEILQEMVLAEELQASEEMREAQLRDLQPSRQKPRLQGVITPRRDLVPPRPPKLGEKSPPSQLRDVLREAESGATAGSASAQAMRAEERGALRQLEQRAWRAQNAVRASEAHEDLLQAHRRDLERKLSEVQVSTEELSCMTALRTGIPVGLVDEANQLPPLEEWEAGLAERVRQGAEAEVAAEQAAARLQSRIQDLENECGELWLDSTLGDRGSQEVARAREILEMAFPTSEPGQKWASLDQLLDQLDAQRQAVREELKIEVNKNSPLEDKGEERCSLMESEIQVLRSEANANSEEASALEAQMRAGLSAANDVEDRLSEAASLRRENDVMRRQQQQWQKSQLRMLRLIEDMQRQRVRDVQSQATVAARLAELQRMLPMQELNPGTSAAERGSTRSYPSSRSPSPPRGREFGSPGDPQMLPKGASRLNAIWSDNVALQSQLRRLEEEKADLIRSQEGLIKMVKSKMPTAEQARDNMRRGQPLVPGRRLGF